MADGAGHVSGGDARGRGRGAELAVAAGRFVVLVAGVRLLRAGALRVAQLVELPRLLDERGAVVLALLPQRRGDALVARPVGERRHLK